MALNITHEQQERLQKDDVTALRPTKPLPTHGQTIIFERVPAGAYCQLNKCYLVERRDDEGDFRFVNVRNGIGTFAKPWAVASASWRAAE